MAEFYTRFIKETFDENGRLTACSYVYDENFNYGYDVIDPLGTLCPDRQAMIWRHDRADPTVLPFGVVKRLSTSWGLSCAPCTTGLPPGTLPTGWKRPGSRR